MSFQLRWCNRVAAKQRQQQSEEESDLSKNEIIEETKEEFNKLKKSKFQQLRKLFIAVEKSMG